MVVNRRGVAAGGAKVVAVENVVPPPFVGVPGGNPRWCTDRFLIAQTLDHGARLAMWDAEFPNAPLAIVSDFGMNHLFAGGGQWARYLDPPPGANPATWKRYLDSYGPDAATRAGVDQTDWAPLAVDNETGRIAVILHRSRGAGLGVWNGTTVIEIEPGIVEPEACYKNGQLLYKVGGEFRCWPAATPPPSQVPVRGVVHSRGWRAGFQDDKGLLVYPWNGARALVMHAPGESIEHDFDFDLQTMDDGTLVVASGYGPENGPGEHRKYIVDPIAQTVNGQRREWVDLFTATAPPAIPVPESVRNGWFGLTDATGLPGNCCVGWYDEDHRPCIEAVGPIDAPWVTVEWVKEQPSKLLALTYSPIEDEKADAQDRIRLGHPADFRTRLDRTIEVARTCRKTILVYCDAPIYRQDHIDLVGALCEDGLDAFMFLQAFPALGETTIDAFARIDKQIDRLLRFGDRLAVWRYARFGDPAKPDAVVAALHPLLTERREQTPQILIDVGYRKIHNKDDGIKTYYADIMRAMAPGVPGAIYRPPTTPPIEPPVTPPITPPVEPIDPEEPDMPPPTDPLKPGMTVDAYLDAIARVIEDHTNVSFVDGRQGALQAWDQQNKAKTWMSGQACLRGGFCRDGQDSVLIDATVFDVMSPLVAAIDAEFLQGR